MHFKSVQIFFDLKKADRCKKWWICSKNPKIINFCVFLCFSVLSCDLPGVAGHALCLQVSSVYQSVGPGHTSSVVLFLWAGHVAFGGLSPTGQRAFLFALLPGSIPLIHSTHMESNVEQSNLCQHSHFFHFSKPFIQSPVHGSNSLAGCFQCFSFFHCSCLISLKHIVS